MADERPPIEDSGASRFRAEADKTLRQAEKVVQSAGRAAAAADDAAAQINRRARSIARKLSVQSTDAGRYYVEETTGRGAARRSDVAMREGQQRPGYYRTQERAQEELATIARERAAAERRAATAADEVAAAGKQEAAASRTRARKTRTAPDPDAAFNKIVAQNNERMRRALGGPAKEEFERRSAPTPAARQQAELEAARRAAYRPGTDIIPHPTEFGQRVPGSFGQVWQRRGARGPEETGVFGGARSDLQRAQLASARADREAQQAAAAVKRLNARKERATDEELAAAREARAGARDRAAAARREVQSIAEGIGARLAEKQARLEAARMLRQQTAQEYASWRQTTRALGGAPQVDTSALERRAAAAQFQRWQQMTQTIGAGGLTTPGHGQYASPIGPTINARQAASAARAADQAAASQDRLGQSTAYVEQREAAVAARQRALVESYRQLGATTGLVDQGMRKHGALTTEFIDAAVRGEASYKEWGYQIGATAAKFAGWTAVSIPVFAALDGVRRIGQGAIASSSGVQQLQRVLNDVDGSNAQEAFRDLSSQFNVPIQATTDAIFRMGTVFHTLPAATEAARAALYSFKVGGVDVETSTRNLNAIVQGFGATAGDLSGYFDQINQAQNQFGITIQNTEAGVAKAAGTFKNAGGDFSYLLALIATGQRATGRTGENIGTAIQRSVGFIQRPTNQRALQEFGIDTSRGIESIYTQAFDVAQQLSGEQLQKLATALSSPQYASYFIPILRSRGLFNNILSGTSPEASRGSAAKELDSVLGQLDERIAQVGNSFERLGSTLGQSGFTAPLVGAVGSMNLLLGSANGLLGIFASMPVPLRLVLATMLQIRAATAVARRFGLGESLQQGPLSRAAPYLIESPNRRASRAIDKGVRDTVGAARDEQQRAVSSAFRATSNLRTAEKVAQDQLAAIEANISDEAQATLAREKVYRDLERYEERAVFEGRRATEALRYTAAEEFRQQSLREAQQGLRGAAKDSATVQWGIAHGANVPPSLRRDLPLSELAKRIETIGFDPMAGGGLGGVVGETVQQAPARRIRGDIGNKLRGAGQTMAVNAEALRNIARFQGPLAAASIGLSAAAGTAGAGATRLARGTAALPGRLAGVASSIGGAGRSLLAMIGPWNLMLGALLLLPEAAEALKNVAKRQTARLDQLTRRPTNAADRDKLRQQQIDAANAGNSWGERISDLFSFRVGGDSTGDQRRNIARRALDDLNRQDELNARRRTQGLPELDLSVNDIASSIDEDYKAFKDGRLTLDELRKRVDLRLGEIANSSGTTAQKTDLSARARARFGQVGTQRDFYDRLLGTGSLDQIPTDVLDDRVAGLQALVGANQATDRQIEQYRAALLVVMAQTRGSEQTTDRQRFAAASQAYTETIANAAQDELQKALALAKSQSQRNQAYEDYYAATSARGIARPLQRRVGANQRDAEQGLADSQAREVFLTQQRDSALAAGHFGEAAKLYVQIGVENVKQSGLKALIDHLGKNKKDVGELARQVAKEDKAAAEAIRRQQFEENEAIRQASVQVSAFGFRAGSARTAFMLRAAGRAVTRAIAEYGRRSTQALSAIQQQESLQEQAAQQQLSELQARQGVTEARLGDKAGPTIVADLRAQLAFMQSHKGFSQDQIDGVRAQIINQIRQNAEDAKEQAREDAQNAADLLRARYEYLESLTDNPVKQAQLEARLQRELLKPKYTKGLTPAEKLQQRAEANRSKQAAIDAASQRRVEDLEYQHDIGRLTDEAFLSALQAELRRLKKGTEAYRSLKQQIGRFKKQMEEDTGDYELNVGNIRLPTVYEVRRAVLGGDAGVTGVNPNVVTGGVGAASISSASSVVNNNQTITVYVANPEAAQEVARVFEQTMGRAGQAVGRNMGLR